MQVLEEVIESMTKEQVRHYKLFQKRSHSKNYRLDTGLFDFIRKNGLSADEQVIFRKLYPKGSKNSFYRLRHRLLQEVNKSLLLQYVDEEEGLKALFHLAMARFHFKRNHFHLVGYFLKKAEAEALQVQDHELLDIIYGEYIRLSHELPAIDPEPFIEKRKENGARLLQVRVIDDILAVVTYKMKRSQNFATEQNPVMPMLQEIVDRYADRAELAEHPSLRSRLYHAVTQILLQQRNYPALEEFLLNTYEVFQSEKLFNRANHEMKLQMLVYIVNALFKNNKLSASLQYTELLGKALEEHHRLYYDRFLFFYYNSLVINYSRSDRTKAVSILLEMKANEKICANPLHEMFVYLNLAVSYFDLKDYRSSVRHLHNLYLLDGYKSADASLRFKIAIAELMIRFEMGDYDFLENKIRQIRKEYSSSLSAKGNLREAIMVKAILAMMETGGLQRNKSLMTQIRHYILEEKNEDIRDAQILDYKAWLKEKIPRG